MQQMRDIQQGFKWKPFRDGTKFKNLMLKMLCLSSQEENLKSEVEKTCRNSSRLKDLAAGNKLWDQLQSITNQMMELSKETFAITPEIGSIGKQTLECNKLKKNLQKKIPPRQVKAKILLCKD